MSEEIEISFNRQIKSLAKGETLSRTERYEIGSKDAANINEALQRMRRNVNAAVSRIREATSMDIRTESGTMITNDNTAILATVAITRF